MAVVVEDVWEVVALMLEGLECSAMHKEEKWFGRQLGPSKNVSIRRGMIVRGTGAPL